MMKLTKPALILVLVLSSGTAAQAGPAADLVFSEGVFLQTAPGTVLSYTHQRLGQETENFKPFETGAILLSLEQNADRKQLEAEFFIDDTRRGSTTFPADIGNPLIMSFLESSLRAMATLTDGSPFYIRNRIKDDLRDGGTISDTVVTYQGVEIPAQEVRFVPFAEDENRAKMGNFADMELVFVVSDQVPGFIHSMHADTPKAESGVAYFNEIVTLNETRLPE